ncbi:MAG TPA: sigma-54 dependent transcriptional regulator, partial [Candidatus Udaeobacter sp.]|nr:sigma-54 dependent transcriptional regulator [Candidatus Udaeobacter sp.]
MATGRVLIVDDDEEMCRLLAEHLTRESLATSYATSGEDLLRRLELEPCDLLVSDLRIGESTEVTDLLPDIFRLRPRLPVIIITAFGTLDSAVKAMKLGAFDYITKPFPLEALTLAVRRALEHRALEHEVAELRRQLGATYDPGNLLGRSPIIAQLRVMIERVAVSNANILITGESGVGKEVVARMVHAASGRTQAQFVPINCAAIPETLLESELFGHTRGAFTGASGERRGLFAEADGGTLFLDEIAEMAPGLQAKLLRVLQDGEVRPLGQSRALRVDVRVIAATNRIPEEEMAEGRMREDLYYRLSVVHLEVPPLRERREDILVLAENLMAKAAAEYARPTPSLSPEVASLLLDYPWPGNVREL